MKSQELKVINDLRYLAQQMENVGCELSKLQSKRHPTAEQHGTEMIGAAGMADDWADDLEKECQ